MTRAIILAAGRGSRMGRLTDHQPKCLTKLANKPLLEWQLDNLRLVGCEQIGVVTGYMSHLLNNYDIYPFANHRWHETNMVTSLLAATDWLDQFTCIVSYADIFYSAATIQALINTNAELSITYDPNWQTLWKARFENPLSDAETFRINPEGYLLTIGDKTDDINDIQGQYMGLLKITPVAWRKIKNFMSRFNQSDIDQLSMTSLLNQLLKINMPIKTVPCVEAWGEIDNATDLAYFEKMRQDF
jgi:choline kinase